MKNLFRIVLVLCICQLSFAQKHVDGPFKQYHDNGQLKTEGFYKNDKKIGGWREYYKNGQLLSESTYDNKGHSGNSRSYSKEGILLRESKKLKDGGLITTGYYDSGKLWSVTILKDSKFNFKEYYESEKLKSEGNSVKGELEGVWKSFFEIGQLEWEVNYFNGYKQGSYKQYNIKGKLILEGNHIANLKHGEEKRYDVNGNLEWSGTNFNDYFDGEWTQFDSLGNVINVLKYKEGKLKKSSDDLVLNSITIPDGHFENVPIYPGCENALGFSSGKKCMSDKISEFVAKKFNTYLAKELGLTGRQRINVIFKIDKTGNVIDIRARAPHPDLEKEAIRVINTLPKMIPGKQRGKEVVVPYSLPIVFVAPEKTIKNNAFDDPFFKQN